MPPTVTLTDPSISYAPKFTVSPWIVGEYNSIDCEYRSPIGGTITSFSGSWIGEQIPGITISSRGDSILVGDKIIWAVNNNDGTYSYYFKISGTPTTKGIFNVRNALLPPQIANGMWFNFTIIGDEVTSPIVTLTDPSISYAPKFTVSPWRLGEYNSIDAEYKAPIGGNITSFSGSWIVGQIPGITISPRGDSVSGSSKDIWAVSNNEGTHTYYFRISGTPTTKGIFDVRNRLLPPQIANGMWFNFTIIDDYGSEGTHSSNKSHSSILLHANKVRVSVSSAIEFLGAGWLPNKQMWDFEYRMAGIGHTNNVSGINDRISYARILIKPILNGSNMLLWPTPTDARYIGSTPASSTGTNYSGVANAVVGLALNANPPASVIWSSVSALIAALASIVNGSTSTSQLIERSWSWWPLIYNASQFFWFDVLVEPNKRVEFSYDYTIVGNPFGILGVTGHRQLYAGPAGGDRSMNPEKMTSMEKEQCGISTVSRENIMTGAVKLDISERLLKEWLDSDKDVFYHTKNFAECEILQSEKVESNESTSIKDLLSEELFEQIERSELIINAFSMDEICDADDSKAIVKKQSDRLESLLKLQKLLEVHQKKEPVELKKIFDGYLKVAEADDVYQERINKNN